MFQTQRILFVDRSNLFFSVCKQIKYLPLQFMDRTLIPPELCTKMYLPSHFLRPNRGRKFKGAFPFVESKNFLNVVKRWMKNIGENFLNCTILEKNVWKFQFSSLHREIFDFVRTKTQNFAVIYFNQPFKYFDYRMPEHQSINMRSP